MCRIGRYLKRHIAAQYWGCTICLFSTSITVCACTEAITKHVQCQAMAILVNSHANIVQQAGSRYRLRTHALIQEEGCCHCAIVRIPDWSRDSAMPRGLASGWWLAMSATSLTVFNMASMSFNQRRHSVFGQIIIVFSERPLKDSAVQGWITEHGGKWSQQNQ